MAFNDTTTATYVREGIPEHLRVQSDFDTLFKTEKVPQIACGSEVGGVYLGNTQRKGCLFLEFCPLLFSQSQYIPIIPHQSPPPPQTASPRHYFFSGKLKAHDRGRYTLANLQR